MSKLGNVVLVGTIVVLSGPLALAAISTTFVAATLLLLFAGAVFVHAVLKSLYQVTTWPFSTHPTTLTTTAVPNSPRSSSLKPAAKGQAVTAPHHPPSLAIKTGRWTSSSVSKAGSCSPESTGSVTSSYSRSSSSSSNGGSSSSTRSTSSASDGAIEHAHIINGISQAVGNAAMMEGSLRGGLSRRRRPAASLIDFYDDEFDDADFVDEVYFPEDEDMDGPWAGLGAELSRHRHRSYDHTLLRRHRSASVAGFIPPVASNSSRRRASIAELPSVLQSATMSSISYRRSSTPGRRRVRLSDYGL
ncbi:hypothetical protein PpBr36_02897 [Pyricularia pennisetigena]|uniref:hypothetical protein n=1 Tax=Pyricularia pennisetigena TaxID=1578925 RepID=UPI00114E8998|nr:hypothetical protein PpBr36_02897 [Pyricularia pennisetigena]TLS31261.1 hypothetical protein PpBr36_02897 [Pyricularia pennisetigena]